VVHGSEVTLFITCIVILVLTRRASIFSNTLHVAGPSLRVAFIPTSAGHRAPISTNSRSTRRERRIQHSIRSIT